MNFDQFVDRFRHAVPEGTVLENPGGGTPTIRWFDGERLCYQRARSRFCVSFEDLHRAYVRFAGSNMTTRDLKNHAPCVYDSGALQCYCSYVGAKSDGVSDTGMGSRQARFSVRCLSRWVM
jgi:hypothetical protein